LEAANRQEAVGVLHKKELIVLSLTEAKGKAVAQIAGAFGKKVKLDDLVVFARQLATMVDAGIPLVGALDILGQQVEKKAFKAVVVEIRDRVEAGASLSDAMAKHKAVFSDLFINMVRAGEASGMLDEILERVAEYMEKTNALQHKVRSALVYPAVVSGMAVAITLILMIKVIPVFKDIYSGFGAALPRPTQVLIFISDILGKFFPVAIGVLIGLGFLFNRYLKTNKGRLFFDILLLNLPVFGILFKKVAVSKFTRTLSTLMKSGVPILSALEIVSKTSGNKAVEQALDMVRKNVREGERIADPLSKSKIFPPMVVRMVSVGEQAGQLEKMLTKIADFYEEQVDVSVSGLTSLIEPLIIAFLGIVIGTIVICMFLPIFRITSVMGG
jgi:type IV pilus assembly protein PilC